MISTTEKYLLCQVVNPTPLLDYPLKEMTAYDGSKELIYDLPEDIDRKKLLNELYPFLEIPKIDEMRYDLHEQKHFVVRDYVVVRHEGRNLLASPYYLRSGGMVVDWIDDGKETAHYQTSRVQVVTQTMK